MSPNGTSQYAAQKLPPIPSTLAFFEGHTRLKHGFKPGYIGQPLPNALFSVGYLRQTLPEALAFFPTYT